MGTFVETPLLSDSSTREILRFSVVNGRTSQHEKDVGANFSEGERKQLLPLPGDS
jgi:hypothetical protein